MLGYTANDKHTNKNRKRICHRSSENRVREYTGGDRTARFWVKRMQGKQGGYPGALENVAGF